MSSDISGVSRSGRVRKKSAKLKEMEEVEKTDVNTSIKHNNSKESNSSFMSNGSNVSISSSELDTPKKSKKLKIKFSSLENGVEEIPIDNEIDQSDLDSSNLNNKHELTVPSLKIKLFQNSNDNYCTSPTKKKSSTKKLYSDNENAANLLFQQITSGHVNDHKKKYKKKVYNDPEENVLFDPNDESYSEEEASLVISDSNESLQAALDHAKSIKNPNRRLTETKIDYKFGVMKVKKIDVKPDKKQKLSKITAYTLFARENRSRIQQSYPTLDFAHISKRLGEVWQALPQREKMQWKRKAQKQKGMSTGIKTVNDHKIIAQKPQNPTLSQLKQQLPIRYGGTGGVSINHARNKQQLEIKVNLNSKTELFDDKQIRNYLDEQQTRQPKITNTVDIASYLHILGESLNAISTKLNNLNQQNNNKEQQNFNDQYALDLLLDSAICAISPLICLANNSRPELKNCCDEKTQKQLIDNVAFLMPGI